MAQTKTSWQKGVSGNPAGRPPKSRALTALLEKAGSRVVELPSGERIASKRWLARALWELVTTLQVILPDGRIVQPEPEGWFDAVKFIYGQIDGPPKQQFGVDFSNMTDEQLVAFIAAEIRAFGAGDDRSTAPEAARTDKPTMSLIP